MIKKNDYIHIRVSKEEKEKIKNKADKKSLDISSYARMVLLERR